MTTTDANPPLPEFRTDYLLMEVDADSVSYTHLTLPTTPYV